jgi:hypothetical protein
MKQHEGTATCEPLNKIWFYMKSHGHASVKAITYNKLQEDFLGALFAAA